VKKQGILMAQIAIVGAGLIGRSWAIVFARGGHHVRLYDSSAEQAQNALVAIELSVSDMKRAGLVEEPGNIRSRISATSLIRDALEGAEYVQECVPETVELKREVFAELDQLSAPSAILASSTSAILPSLIFEKLPGRARCLVAHPMNPPHLAPVVELCGGPWASAETIQKASQLMESCGQSPIKVKQEIDGFILNRLQHALLNECFRLIGGGFATPDDIDTVVKDGLGLRWSFMGPVETIDLNAPDGVADYMSRYSSIFRRLEKNLREQPDWPEEAVELMNQSRRAKVPREKLKAEQEWRDRRLMALLRHKREAAKETGH
jgi:L-gulonate 3-dehydrogenase